MTDLALIERITRSLAYMLRHQPEAFDLELDAHGFSDLDDVVHALNERLGEPIEEEDVREAVQSGDRPRYQIEGDRIRALYGHSIPVEPGPSSKPPEFLYVAIPASELERARRFGLRGGRRRFLHLAITKEDAAESGRRASRSYAILLIHALDAWEEGVSFFDRVALWLAEEVPTHLIEVEGTYDDGVEPLRRHEHEREHGGHSERGERGRGPERHGAQGAHGGQGGHGGGDGRGRRRRRGGRGRDRNRDDGFRGERREGGRGPTADGFRPEPGPAREPAFDAAPAGRGDREQRRDSFPARGAGPAREHGYEDRPREDRPREDRPREDRPREEGAGRGRDGRRERDEFRTERRPRPEPAARGERERPESRPLERRPEPPRRERAPLPSSGPGGGFGAGLEGHEPPRERERDREAEREARPAPPPPAAPARRDPPDADRPRFGAGL
ncbi:MAG TPA: RNA 2'-phosphotransferase [Planctomycetota bacterium]